ncbi:hypothetical protein J6590_054448 [Homalodisca vitripennis]|nr:hypothetical protein J6590_054448 [Homalodisca vitripennis]
MESTPLRCEIIKLSTGRWLLSHATEQMTQVPHGVDFVTPAPVCAIEQDSPGYAFRSRVCQCGPYSMLTTLLNQLPKEELNEVKDDYK